MPIAEIHLVDGRHAPGDLTRLLDRFGRVYAAILDAPVERVRVGLTTRPAGHWWVGGATDGEPAPYWTALVLEGRPVAQRHRLLAELTDVVVDVLGVERARVRGRVVEIPPDDWGIGGVPASAARRTEVAARSAPRPARHDPRGEDTTR